MKIRTGVGLLAVGAIMALVLSMPGEALAGPGHYPPTDGFVWQTVPDAPTLEVIITLGWRPNCTSQGSGFDCSSRGTVEGYLNILENDQIVHSFFGFVEQYSGAAETENPESLFLETTPEELESWYFPRFVVKELFRIYGVNVKGPKQLRISNVSSLRISKNFVMEPDIMAGEWAQEVSNAAKKGKNQHERDIERRKKELEVDAKTNQFKRPPYVPHKHLMSFRARISFMTR